MKKNEMIENDLFFMLTYMASIATAGISRDAIFEHAGNQKEYSIATYFKEVHTLSTKWGYAYARSCKLLSNRAPNDRLSALFGRIATALSSGEPEKDFLKHEIDMTKMIYSNEYERSLEKLKKWTEGYTALLVSTALIVTIILISTMIYPMGNIRNMVFMVTILVLFISGIGVLFVSDAAPYDTKIHSLERCSKEQKWIRLLSKILIPIWIIVMGFFLYFKIHIGYSMIVSSLFMLPIGILAIIDDINIDKRDNDFPDYIKSIGNIAGTMGVTTTVAMENIDKETLKYLNPLLEKLHLGLSMGITPSLCWSSFIEKSGSELINRFVKMFNDSLNLGGDPAEIGMIVSSSSLAIVMMRMKRKLVSASFTSLLTVMHVVMCSLIIFIMEIMIAFNKMVTDMYDAHFSSGMEMGSVTNIGMNMFGAGTDLDLLYNFTFATVIIFTIANASVIGIADGGSRYKLFFYGTMTSMLSGLIIIFLPILVGNVFILEI